MALFIITLSSHCMKSLADSRECWPATNTPDQTFLTSFVEVEIFQSFGLVLSSGKLWIHHWKSFYLFTHCLPNKKRMSYKWCLSQKRMYVSMRTCASWSVAIFLKDFRLQIVIWLANVNCSSHWCLGFWLSGNLFVDESWRLKCYFVFFLKKKKITSHDVH